MKIYKSGDYARWTSLGDVEILGRLDNQIKLRGLRIEIGEIEGSLAKIPAIKSFVVKIVIRVYSKLKNILDAIYDGLNAKIMRVGTLSARYSDGESQINAGINSSIGRLKIYAIIGQCPLAQQRNQPLFTKRHERQKRKALRA